MSPTTMRFYIAVASLTMLSSCAELELEQDVSAASNCGDLCGFNTQTDSHVIFDDLNLDGEENTARVKLLGAYTAGNLAVALEVKEGVLYGLAGESWLALTAGARILIEHFDGSKLVPATLYIDEVIMHDHWVEPDAGQATAYKLIYSNALGDEYGFCPNVPPEDASGAQQQLPAGFMFAFAGDRYDFPSKTVAIDETNRWVNFACSGSVPAKMHLTRHTTAGSTATAQSSKYTRQALLKMFVADYCGTGKSYTEHGTKLRYADANGLFKDFYAAGFDDEVDTFEAAWDQHGARCLTKPRLFKREEIRCPRFEIPWCRHAESDSNTAFNVGALIISGNPLP